MTAGKDEEIFPHLKFGNKYFFSLVVLSLTLLVIYIFPFSKQPIEELELKILDRKFSERGGLTFEDTSDIIILEISQETYDQIIPPYNRWPWARSLYARVIENLTEAGVRAIGIDLLMADADQYSPLNDSLLASAIKNSGKVVFAGQIDVVRERIISRNEYPAPQFNSGRYESLVRKNIEDYGNIFFKNDSSLGIVNIPSDRDGLCRRYMPYVKSELTGSVIPTFGFAILNKYFSLPPGYIAEDLGNTFLFCDAEIPKYSPSSSLINFYCSNDCFMHVKFMDVLDDSSYITKDEEELDVSVNTWDDPGYGLKYSGIFKNKIVLIGSTMPEDKDIVPIPSLNKKNSSGNYVYGVEFHALAISNFLNRLFIKKNPLIIEIASVVLFNLLCFFLPFFIRRIPFSNRIVNELITVLSILFFFYGLYELSFYLFKHFNYYLGLMNPFIAAASGYLANIVFSYLEYRHQNIFIKKSFSRYVSPEIVDEIIRHPEMLKLGGEKRDVTILFADMKDFAKTSEGRSAADMVNFVNKFFSVISGIVAGEKGMIDKFIGDAVMAVWGAPLHSKDHAYSACSAAIKMIERIKSFTYVFENGEAGNFEIRIGINSGEAVVGNFGGDKRFDYTVMGDNVNIAARLEKLNKNYNSSILISQSTYELVKSYFNVKELGITELRGKKEVIGVYELLNFKDVEGKSKPTSEHA